MAQRYICELVWHGETTPVATQRWPLTAADEQAAMEEMFALHTSESQKPPTGNGLGSYSFMLIQATEEEWQALRSGS